MADIERKIESESDIAKSNFLARMSHEMRTPLNAIIGMCTIAQTATDLERINDCLIKINEASVHLLGMINDVLDLAKIEAGNFELTNSEFNFTKMLRKIADALKFNLDAKKQNLVLDFDPGLPETVIADQQRLAQVLDNLLSNAVKFTPPEGTVTFSIKKIREEGVICTIEVKITDTGIGITEEAIKKLFNIFEQADGSMARKYQGAGMGLIIASSIVHLMGGEIRVETIPGKGSAFSFEISLSRGIELAAGKQNPERRGNVPFVEMGPKYVGKYILLAEDVEINREIVLSLLEDTGIIIDCAENGLRALEKYSEDPIKYNLILMDVHMPEMDGYEATRQIRVFEKEMNACLEKANPRVKGCEYNVPIIAMTANIFKDDVENCLAAGMTDHLGKPIDLEQLMSVLDKFLLKKI